MRRRAIIMKRMILNSTEGVARIVSVVFVADTVAFVDFEWDLAVKLSLISAVITDCL